MGTSLLKYCFSHSLPPPMSQYFSFLDKFHHHMNMLWVFLPGKQTNKQTNSSLSMPIDFYLKAKTFQRLCIVISIFALSVTYFYIDACHTLQISSPKGRLMASLLVSVIYCHSVLLGLPNVFEKIYSSSLLDTFCSFVFQGGTLYLLISLSDLTQMLC